MDDGEGWRMREREREKERGRESERERESQGTPCYQSNLIIMMMIRNYMDNMTPLAIKKKEQRVILNQEPIPMVSEKTIKILGRWYDSK